MSPWGLISIGRWQRDREARCKNISCARGLEVGVWLLPTFPHAELRWSHLIVRAARDHYSAVCLEEEEIGLMRAELVFAELSNEKFFCKILLYPFSFLRVPWLTGNLFLTSVLWFCSLLVFQMRSWTVPQMSLYKYVFMICVCHVDQPSHPYSVTKVEDKEKKSKNNTNLVWKLPLMMLTGLALYTLSFPWWSADTGMWQVTQSPDPEWRVTSRGQRQGRRSRFSGGGLWGWHPECVVCPTAHLWTYCAPVGIGRKRSNVSA